MASIDIYILFPAKPKAFEIIIMGNYDTAGKNSVIFLKELNDNGCSNIYCNVKREYGHGTEG